MTGEVKGHTFSLRQRIGLFMICSMNAVPIDSAPADGPPTDPDLKWTGWALDMLRDMIEIDCRTKRMTALQQGQILAGPDAPDYALMQSRLSRSMRLSLAMTERIRADYLSRKAEAEESGERQRRTQRREQAVRAVTEAVAAADQARPGETRPGEARPDETQDIERVRSAVWEKLVEDEILDVQIDTLSAEDFVREVCRWLGRKPGRLPQGWDDAVAEDEAAEPLDETLSETLADPPSAAPEPGEAAPPGRKPDSS
jgi:hypothetical protein